jgi:phage-related protein
MTVWPGYESVLIHSGRYFAAEWYYTAEGRLPALDYYYALAEVDQDRFDDMIRYLCETKPGALLPKTLYRIEDHAHKIYALKPRNERFFNFMTIDAKIIVTNAYHKHSQQMTKADLECLKTAVRRKQDYLRRAMDGTYYEK